MATSFWNYVDALAYALALNSPEQSEKFTADPAKWHQAIYDLRKKYVEKFPRAFSKIIFDVRPGRTPYSPQVEHFLHVQAQARLMSAANPAYEVLEISTKQKEAIIRLNESRLGEFRDLLKQVGEELSVQVRHGE